MFAMTQLCIAAFTTMALLPHNSMAATITNGMHTVTLTMACFTSMTVLLLQLASGGQLNSKFCTVYLPVWLSMPHYLCPE